MGIGSQQRLHLEWKTCVIKWTWIWNTSRWRNCLYFEWTIKLNFCFYFFLFCGHLLVHSLHCIFKTIYSGITPAHVQCTSALSISAAKIQNAAVLKFSVYEFCITLQKNRTFTHFMFPFLKGNGWMRQLPHIRSSLLSLHNLERGTVSWELFLYEWYKTNKQLNLRQTRRKQSVDGKCGMHCTLMYRWNSSNMSLK